MTAALAELYHQFLNLKRSGQKQQARHLADQIIANYQMNPDYGFVLDICDATSQKLDHILWQRLVFPEIQNRLDEDPKAIKALIQTIQNLYSSREEWGRLGYVTEQELTQRLLKLSPQDTWAMAARARILHTWLAYVIHEWPSGILYGPDGATLDECAQILSAVDELRQLNETDETTAFCNGVREKTLLYMGRLSAKL